MMFNPSKYEHLQITLKKQPLPSSYNLYDYTIQHVSSINYLGVTINSKLNWSDHITKVVNKANRTRAILQRNLKQCPCSIKIMCYESYVRPILEYSCTVWAPFTHCDIYKLELVQRRAARFLITISLAFLVFLKCLLT